jgi:hypothetical protein
MGVRVADVAAISALAIVITIAVAVPVLQAPSERVFGMETVGRHHDPFTAMEQFDRPITLGVYSQPLTDFAGAMLARVSGPVAAYNWLVLLTFPVSAAAAYLLARHLTLSLASAALVALAFAFSPFHLAQAAYHPHIAQTQWIPLYLLALWRCLDHATAAAIGLLGLSIVAVTLSSFYGGLIAAVITPVATAAYWFFKSRHEPLSTRRLAVTTGCLIVAAAGGAAYAWYAAHAAVVNGAAFAHPRLDLFRYSAKWWSYLVPPLGSPLFGSAAARLWNDAGVQVGLLEQQVSLGWGVVLLGLVGVFAWSRGRRTVTSLTVVPLLAAVAAFALVCSLSPERTVAGFTFSRPSAFFFNVVPMFRSYARFGVVVQLMAVLLAGIGAEYLWRSGTRLAKTACVFLVILAAAEYAVSPATMWRDVLPTRAHRWVARQGDGVRALDCAMLNAESRSIQWLTSYRIGLRTPGFDDCTQPNLADKLAAAGYTYLIVRRQTPDDRWFEEQAMIGGLELAEGFSDGRVFSVVRKTPSLYTAQMTAFYPRERNDTWAWRWMGPTASWTVVNRTNQPLVATLHVDISAFHAARGLSIRLDGREVQALVIGVPRHTTLIGPLVIMPGDHELVFNPTEPPGVADRFLGNGDDRALSFAVGTWYWQVQGANP